MNPFSRFTGTKRRSALELVGLTALLAFGVVAWQHLLHATLLLRSDAGIGTHLPHMVRDGMLALPIAALAIVMGRNLAGLLGGRSGGPSWLRAAVTTEIYMLVMIAAVPVHGKIDAALGGAHIDEGWWLTHALRDALIGQFAAMPLMTIGLWAAANPHRAFSRDVVMRASAVVGAVVVLTLAGVGGVQIFVLSSVVAVLAAAGRRGAIRLVAIAGLVASLLASPTPLGFDSATPAGAATDVNGCDTGANVRSYDVAAINIEMTLNQFGDHDPNAFMYVLENRIADVRAQETAGTVSPGLRDDAIQPLVIRANVGECLEINFRNGLTAQDASLSVFGLPFTAANGAGHVGDNPNTLVAPGNTMTYRFPIADNPSAEGAYNFHSLNDPRQTMAHGLFGTLVVEPRGSVYLHPEDSSVEIESGWEAIIVDPRGIDFREFVIMMHEVGDEEFNVTDGNGEPMPQIDDVSGSYRPGSRALNYRSEPFRDRLLLDNDKSLAYSSYTFGDPATPIPRSYLGEPTKTRLSHPGSELFHVYHLHGGGNRWPRNPDASTSNFATGLDKVPPASIGTSHIDSQAAGPGETFNLEHECGAGGCQQAAGDYLFHCHIGAHYVSGMWSFWRVFDTAQADLAQMPEDPGYMAPPVAQSGNSLDLIGTVVDGQTIVAAADADLPSELALEDYVAELLPPQGVTLDDEDATVWDWVIDYVGGDLSQPLVLGEPDDTAVWPNYQSATPGVRPEVEFNLGNGRLAWPVFEPHLGKRPPFAPNGHGGAPWLGTDVTATRPDGLCPTTAQVPGRRRLDYPITAIDVPIPLSPTITDPNGMLFALSEDVDDIVAETQAAEPLVLRSNIGDCLDILLTSQQQDVNHNGFAKVNMHTHFVQFDPQASDGVITGMSYEQSVRPYATENRTLSSAAGPGDTVINVNDTTRLRVGISIGVGLGEGMCDPGTGAPVADPDFADRRCTEIRTITALTPTSITLDAPLVNQHAAGEAVGVEFVQYRWYSDTDSGTVFFHDHVDFTRWDHGLFAAHIVEPKGATYHDPVTGAEIRTGTVADIRTPSGASVGVDETGSFRELMVFLSNQNTGVDLVGGGAAEVATINMRSAPLGDRDGEFPYSSVVNGDPTTPVLRTYVGDNVVIRNLGVVERVGALRVTGHRFHEDRYEGNSEVHDTSAVGISTREDLVLIGGAGGTSGSPGDYLFYSTMAQDTEAGAWGIMRVHDTSQGDLQPLPDGPVPPAGSGFPQQTVTGLPPAISATPGTPCPAFAPVRSYNVTLMDAPLGADFGQSMFALSSDVAAITNGLKPAEPLVLRVNDGECLEVAVSNATGQRAGFNLAKLAHDPQGSSGTAVGFNADSTLDKDQGRTYRFYADAELGISLFYNLVEPRSLLDGGWGAVVVEPAGSSWLSPETGLQIDSGVEAIVWQPGGQSFREFVALFQDEDDQIGANQMPYPVQVQNFTGINYMSDPLRGPLTARMNVAPTSVAFDSGTHGDPENLWEAYVGDDVVVRVGAAAGMQGHVFGIQGHDFPWAPNLSGSEYLSHKGIMPGNSFNLELLGGAGSGIKTGADYLFGDTRMPFLEGGAWGILRTHETPQAGLAPIPEGPDGLLRVTTNPPVPSQIIVNGELRDRWGLKWVKMPPGPYEVCWTDVPGFETPPCENVVVESNQTTTVPGNFTRLATLRVQTSPAVPSTITIDGVPANDWGVWVDVPAGSREVCYGDVVDFDAPPCETVVLTPGASESIVGVFTSNPGAPGPSGHGLLRVTTSPAVPAKIYVDGEQADRWGLNWVKFEPGWHEVCFGDVRGFSTAPCETVLVEAGKTAIVQGDFERRGILRIITQTPHQSTLFANGVALNDWGAWTDLPAGPYEVCFGESDGFAPACQNVVLTPGVTETVTGIWP